MGFVHSKTKDLAPLELESKGSAKIAKWSPISNSNTKMFSSSAFDQLGPNSYGSCIASMLLIGSKVISL
jgi:hypothetical protein